MFRGCNAGMIEGGRTDEEALSPGEMERFPFVPGCFEWGCGNRRHCWIVVVLKG